MTVIARREPLDYPSFRAIVDYESRTLLLCGRGPLYCGPFSSTCFRLPPRDFVVPNLRLSIRLLVLMPGMLFVAAANAHEGDEHDHLRPAAAKPAEVYRPSAVPDRICLALTDDPSTSMAVTWRTDHKVHQGIAQFAVATGGPDFRKSAKEVKATKSSLESDLGVAFFHEVILRDLQPATKYLYRVGDGVNWSEWSEFQTAESENQPFSFVYFGDAQNDIKSHWSRVVRNAFRDAPRAAFFLHAGDLINRAESDAEWGQWFYAGGFIHRTLPAIAIPGNHEMARRVVDPNSDETFRELSHHWRPTFALPTNGPESLHETCFFIDYQGVRIVGLNSNEQQELQATWLEDVLADAKGWKIVTHHHPLHSASKGRDNPELRDLWQPIYDNHGVDLVLQGHDHTYARSDLMRYPSKPNNGRVPVGESNVTEGANLRVAGGTVYVVSVSGPKMYDLDPKPYMRSAAENTQ